LSKHLPIPSMLISIPYPCNAPMNSLLQNWEPQSVLSVIRSSTDYTEDNTMQKEARTAYNL
jgi:hypothetical protein